MYVRKDEYIHRFEGIYRTAIEEEDFDLLLIYLRGNKNMYSNSLYLTGYYAFDPCIEGALIIAKSGAVEFLLNFEWDLDRAAQISWLPRASMGYTRDLGLGLINYCRENHLSSGRIGIVGDGYMSVRLFQKLREGLPDALFQFVTELVERERMIKSPAEIEAMREANRITNQAIMTGIHALKDGISELEIYSICLQTMLRLQADESAFTGQVSFGKMTEVCMAPASQNCLHSGDMIMFDMGCLYEHYVGDLSRTYIFGKPTTEQCRIYDLVAQAQDAAIEAVRPGITAGEIDQIARNIINAAGYGNCFNHWLGRGEGLDLHERPFIEQGDTMELKSGMVFSIEPGIYLPGVGGARLEEVVLVTSEGHDVISERSWMPFG